MTRGSGLRSVAATNSAACPAETDDIVLSSERMPVPPPGRWPAGRVALTLGLIAAIGGVLTVGYVAVTIGFVQLPAGRLLTDTPAIYQGTVYGAAASLLVRSEEHTSELQSRFDLVCRLLLEKRTTI